MGGLHRHNDEGDRDAQHHGWEGSIRCMYCDWGEPSDGRMLKPNQGLCAADGTDICPQSWISKAAEEHLWSFSKAFFGTWCRETTEEGPQPQK